MIIRLKQFFETTKIVLDSDMLVGAAGPEKPATAHYGLFWREVFRVSKMMVNQTMCGD
jgi:hypothetical protein